MAKGTIKRLITDRGYGFIKTEEETELFFHRNCPSASVSNLLAKMKKPPIR